MSIGIASDIDLPLMRHKFAAPATTSRPLDHFANGSAATALAEKRFSPSKLVAITEVLGEEGISASTALLGTGLDGAAIANPFMLTSSLQYLTVARNAVRACGASDLGLRVGRRLHASSYGMYGYALLCSLSFAHVCDTAVKYHCLANRLLDMQWIEQDGVASWLFPNKESVFLPDLDDRLYQFLIDLQFAAHVTVIKDVMGSWCVPARALFTRAEPTGAAVLSEALECPVIFGQPQNVLSYPAAWLSRAPQLANPITAAQVSTHCARLLEEFRWQPGVAHRVYQELTRTPGRFPEIEQIAEALCMASRTLRRKLEAEGTSYSDLLASVRKALAIDYLGTTQISTEDIALALGFSDAAGFRHAFKRWAGKTPAEFRRDCFSRQGQDTNGVSAQGIGPTPATR